MACGHRLPTGLPRPPEVRKTVTVIFCDVVGSTALGERLDPESLRRLMARYFQRMSAAIERHGGTVEKFVGDAIMAVFGVPVAHEDDGLRAVRAAADMRSELERVNSELRRTWDVSLAMRVGVNSGEVVAGRDPDVQTLVTGDAVNVAARLEQAAGPGEILLGPATYRLVRDAVTVEPVAALSLKGKRRPVEAVRLVDVSPHGLGHARRLDAPMVGRRHELALLRWAFERVAREGSCHLVTVLGPAGVGKSRLVAEALEDLPDRAVTLTGRCPPYGAGITYWPVAEIVREGLGAADGAEPERVRDRLASALRGEPDAALIAARVAELVGLDQPSAPADETAWAVRKLLESLARRRPVVVVVDDVHWAQPMFLDLAEHIADWSRDSPILLVAVGRPELLEQRPNWGGGKLNATTMLLEPLTDDESSLLLEELLGAPLLTAGAQAHILRAAEGNPLFLEEMLAMLIEEDLLRREEERWMPAGDLSTIAIPPTVNALLAARLDRLPPDERRVLERAAVVGQVFDRRAVEALSPAGERAAVTAHLRALVRKELLRADRSRGGPDDRFTYRHLLIRDAVYEAIPKEERSGLHERFADWVEASAGPLDVDRQEIAGYHLERAYRYRTELGAVDAAGSVLAGRAAERLAAGGRRALARGDMPAAVNLLSRSVSLLPRTDPARLALLPDLGLALAETSELERADAVLSEAVELAGAAGDRRQAALADLGRLQLQPSLSPQGWADEAERRARRAIDVFTEVGDQRGLARAWGVLAEVCHVRCQVAASETAQQQAIEHARQAGDEREEARHQTFFTGSGFYGPAPVEEVIRRCDHTLRRFPGNRTVEARTLRVLAGCKAMQGAFDEARRIIGRSLGIFADLGQAYWLAASADVAGFIEWLAGDLAAAERELRHCCDDLERMGEKSYLSTVGGMLARVVAAQGRDEEALRLSQVSEASAAGDDVDSQVRWRLARAPVLSRRGDSGQAERLAREAVELVAGTDVIDLHADALVELAAVLRRADRPGEAVAALREAGTLYQRKGNVVSAGRVKAALAELGG